MLIRLGYDITFNNPAPVPVVALLHVHAAHYHEMREPDELHLEPAVPIAFYTDVFNNLCSRFLAPAGEIRLYNSTLIEVSGGTDLVSPHAPQHLVQDLPSETLQFLLSSRYCEVDLLSNTATMLFGHTAPGWSRVQAICNWVHRHITFGYNDTHVSKTALNAYNEATGVCRDFQHLAITFCRCMNIPARYATGYLGDIGVPYRPPMDFSAWFEAYLGGRWWTFDARNNIPRIGRVLMATGRDAADVALTTSFGSSFLTNFTVITDEVPDAGNDASVPA